MARRRVRYGVRAGGRGGEATSTPAAHGHTQPLSLSLARARTPADARCDPVGDFYCELRRVEHLLRREVVVGGVEVCAGVEAPHDDVDGVPHGEAARSSRDEGERERERGDRCIVASARPSDCGSDFCCAALGGGGECVRARCVVCARLSLSIASQAKELLNIAVIVRVPPVVLPPVLLLGGSVHQMGE